MVGFAPDHDGGSRSGYVANVSGFAKGGSMKTGLPFLLAAAAWLAVSTLICWKMAHFPGEMATDMKWMVGLAALCLLDLLALAQLVKNTFKLMETGENRFFSAIRASYWGTLKLACIVIFGTIFWKIGSSQAIIPAEGVLAGISTLVVVPLLGGLLHHLMGSEKLTGS
jgi:membrane protein DedA with SNARE-associated domain